MKKFNKIMTMLVVIIAMVAFVAPVFGITFDDTVLQGGTASGTVGSLGKDVWATVSLVVQILAVAAIVFAGVRYMFASADTKADIKKQTIILVVGAILVFGATFIIKLVTSATGEILG